jgi:hypothetical protein
MPGNDRNRASEMTTMIDTAPAESYGHLTRARSADLAAVVDIVIPVYNEEADLGPSVRRLDAFLAESFPYNYVITIADNASTDGTWSQAGTLTAELPRVRAVHLDQKGRGGARSRRSGRHRRPRSSRTWTLTCPQTCGPCSRWSPR